MADEVSRETRFEIEHGDDGFVEPVTLEARGKIYEVGVWTHGDFKHMLQALRKVTNPLIEVLSSVDLYDPSDSDREVLNKASKTLLTEFPTLLEEGVGRALRNPDAEDFEFDDLPYDVTLALASATLEVNIIANEDVRGFFNRLGTRVQDLTTQNQKPQSGSEIIDADGADSTPANVPISD